MLKTYDNSNQLQIEFFFFYNNGYFIRKNVKYNINARQLSFIN